MSKLNFLQSLVKSYPSDIDSHGYLEPLSRHLPDKCRSMLEIGIAQGFSARIWNAFYGSDELDLHYLDLFENPDFVSARWCRNNGFVPHIGSQASLQVLSQIHDKFSLVLDDGSHVAAHMWISFKHLFVNNLLPNGTYIISDCHCNKDSFFWGEGVEVFEDTPIWVFKHYLETGRIRSRFFNEGESGMFENMIKSVHIEADEKLIIITKK